LTVAIGYLDGPRLRRSLLAAAQWVRLGREELNRINVFPVPDGDTGTNFALTMKSISDALNRLGDAPLPEVSRTAAQAAVMGSRGNSGMMLSHFLVGFDEGLGARFRVRARELAAAIRRGFQRLEGALEHPVEGTILTVCREAAAGAERAAAADETDVDGVIRGTLRHAEVALEHTPDLLADLKRAGVVDAGGKGFVRMIEGIVRLIDGHMEEEAEEDAKLFQGAAPAATFEVSVDSDYRWCTEVLVRGDTLPSSTAAREALHELGGGSLIVLRTADLLRVHVHINDPEPLFQMAERWGEVVTRKAEDMREQHRMLADTQRAVAIVVDSACDLPDDVLDRHGIALIPLQVMAGERALQDRLEIGADEVYQLLRAGQTLTTSQPTVAQMRSAFEHARAGAERVVAVLLSSGLSGTFGNGEAALKDFAPGGVRLVDSKSASLGEGLLALRGAELAEAGWEADDIGVELERLRHHAGMLFTVATLDNLVRSGRVSRMKGWLGNLLDMKPILSINEEGKVVPVDRVRGAAGLLPRVLALLDQHLPARPLRLRMGVVHADVAATARAVRDALHRRFRPLDIIVSPVTAVIGVHAGPGAWGVFWQVEDGIPERPRNKTATQAI
jgi:DegV family protein with EDD domain